MSLSIQNMADWLAAKQGEGRLANIEDIVDTIEYALTFKNDYQGKTVLVTASCTREPIDKVRFISNYSSGKMGFALAKIARARGARVILITGPTSLPPPKGLPQFQLNLRKR
jgi:Phosphopantothenoylcysteine synthetase/decarboxylase